MCELVGKVALVTGAASGIGRAAALRFAKAGAAVMCADIDAGGAKETAERIAAEGGRGASLALDVTDEAAVRGAIERTATELGDLNVLFNNAGVGVASFDRTLDVNLKGVYYGLRHGAERIAARGGGAIVNTASIAGMVGLVGLDSRVPLDGPLEGGGVGYIASKHGVVGLTRQFALHYARRGVRINAVAPGYIATPMTSMLREKPELEEHVARLHPMGRLGRPEEIAEAALFLASDLASFITGIVLPVDGGYTAR
jgi:NAD(P)-dependent dehydrogenase (short-subunit alcohol dehydrogenase family)